MKKHLLILLTLISFVGYGQTIIDPSATPTTTRINDAITSALTATGTDAYSVSVTGTYTYLYLTGKAVSITFTNPNTGASTLNFDGLGVKDIKKWSSGSLADPSAGDLIGTIRVRYDGTRWVMEGGSGSGGGGVTSIATTSPITGGTITTTGTIGINNAAADGSTKGAASFTANDFDASSGNISIDYTNGQAASGSTKGFLTSSDWTTFNNKLDALTAGTAINIIGDSINVGGDIYEDIVLNAPDGVAGIDIGSINPLGYLNVIAENIFLNSGTGNLECTFTDALMSGDNFQVNTDVGFTVTGTGNSAITLQNDNNSISFDGGQNLNIGSTGAGNVNITGSNIILSESPGIVNNYSSSFSVNAVGSSVGSTIYADVFSGLIFSTSDAVGNKFISIPQSIVPTDDPIAIYNYAKQVLTLDAEDQGDDLTRVYKSRGITTNNTLTTILTLPVSTTSMVLIDGFITGFRSTTSAAYKFTGAYYNIGGTITTVGTPTITIVGEQNAAYDFQVNVSGTNLLFQCLGATGQNVNWNVDLTVYEN